MCDFPAWPPHWDQAVPIPPADVPALTADVQNWLWRDDETSLLTVVVSETGIRVRKISLRAVHTK